MNRNTDVNQETDNYTCLVEMDFKSYANQVVKVFMLNVIGNDTIQIDNQLNISPVIVYIIQHFFTVSKITNL